MYQSSPGLALGATVDLNRVLREHRGQNLSVTADRRVLIKRIGETLAPYTEVAIKDAHDTGFSEGYQEGRTHRLERDAVGQRPLTLTMEVPETEFAYVLADAETIGKAITKALLEYTENGGDLEKYTVKAEAYELSYESGIRVHIEGYLRKDHSM